LLTFLILTTAFLPFVFFKEEMVAFFFLIALIFFLSEEDNFVSFLEEDSSI